MKNESPIPGLKVAGPDDLQQTLLLQVAMAYSWIAYFNQRVLQAVKRGWKRRLTHVKFVPDVENGLLYVLPALKTDYGAIQLDYTGPETGAEVSLYIPLLKFDLTREEGRQRIFEVKEHEVEGKTYVVLDVGGSTSVPSKRRAAGEGQGATTVAQTAASRETAAEE
ncbi:MAG: hypothetical protein ACOY94_02270 [Bacillota bacterium]